MRGLLHYDVRERGNAVSRRTLREIMASTGPITAEERQRLVKAPLPRIHVEIIPGRSHGGHAHYDDEGRKVLTPNSYNARSFGQDLVTQE